MAAAAGEGSSSSSREVLFETRHGELVEEAGALAAACGAGVTVLTVSPRSGAPRVSRYAAAGRGPEQLARALRRSQEKVPGMSLAQVLAFEERLWAVKLRVLRRIREEEAAGGAASEDQPTEPPPKQRRLG